MSKSKGITHNQQLNEDVLFGTQRKNKSLNDLDVNKIYIPHCVAFNNEQTHTV